jgi:hypothetical protein
LPMQPPFAAGIDQSVAQQRLQNSRQLVPSRVSGRRSVQNRSSFSCSQG